MDQNNQKTAVPENQQAKAHSNGQTSADGLLETGYNEHEKDMLYRLKGAIDQNGRYSYRLNDMACGLAAGTNVPAIEARYEIEEKFSKQFGVSPHEYLERQFSQRDELKRDTGQTKPKSRGRGR